MEKTMRVKDLSNHLQKKFGRAIKSQGREENVGTCWTYSWGALQGEVSREIRRGGSSGGL